MFGTCTEIQKPNFEIYYLSQHCYKEQIKNPSSNVWLDNGTSTIQYGMAMDFTEECKNTCENNQSCVGIQASFKNVAKCELYSELKAPVSTSSFLYGQNSSSTSKTFNYNRTQCCKFNTETFSGYYLANEDMIKYTEIALI